MAKKSKIARNEQRKVVVERYAAKRLELKKALVDPNGTDESREAARKGPQRIARARAFARRCRRPPSWCADEVRHLACAVPRHGAPWRAARHHQVELVTDSLTRRGPHTGDPAVSHSSPIVASFGTPG